MKKGDKFFLYTIGSCLVIGLALITSGFLFGGAAEAEELLNKNFMKISGPFFDASSQTGEGKLIKNNTTKVLPLSSIKNINVKMTAGEITIKTSGTDEFGISVDGNNGLRYFEKDNTLFISGDKGYTDGDVEILLPSDVTFSDATLNIGTASLTINDMNCDSFNLEVGAGEATLSDIIVNNNAIMNVGAGELDIKDASLNNANIELGMGEFDFEGIITGNLDLDCGMGAAQLKLDDSKENHTIYTDCGMGNIDINGSSKTSIGNKMTEAGNASSVYNISCGMGSVDIDFNK